MTGVKDFPRTDVKPPGPSPAKGYSIINSRGFSGDDDSHFILRPDSEFYRPWLATPGGSAFIWPLGTEGFQYSSNAQAGIHHYIGDNDVDVDIVYPDELHIVLTGIFPGKTSVTNFKALRNVILQPSTEAGKILALPGIESQLLYVQVLNHQFNHDATDRTNAVGYSIEFIKVSIGTKLTNTPLQIPSINPSLVNKDRGKSHRRIVVKGHKQTLRSIAAKVYGNPNQENIIKLINNNQETLLKLGITSFKSPHVKIPTGTKLKF